MTHQIESGPWKREGRALPNFSAALPSPQSDLAQQMLKDPYVFDYLDLSKEYNEGKLALGAGFAYIDRQVPIQVGERYSQTHMG